MIAFQTRFLLLLAACVLVACGSPATGGSGGGGGGGSGAGGGTAGGAAGGAGGGAAGGAGGGTAGGAGGGTAGAGGGGTAGGAGGGTAGAGGGSSGADAGSPFGSVTGSVDGITPFGNVVSSWWIGSPDSAATTVVYLYNKPVACADIQALAWDTRIPNDTQVLEMKMYGTAPATFTVTGSLTPAAGEAAVNHTFSRVVGTPAEQFSSGGTVTLQQRVAAMRAAGTFALNFGAHAMTGQFDAGFCVGGVEP